MRVEARIASAAAKHAARPAIDGAAGERLDYAGLLERVEQVSRQLSRLGAVPGARVALVFENDGQVPIALLGVLTAGACAVPLNARLANAELDAVLAHADPRLVLLIGGEDSAAARHAKRLGAGKQVGLDALDAAILVRNASKHERLPQEVAIILYTAGSTGRPKGVMLTHGNLDFLMAAGVEQDWLRAEDRVLGVLPMSHSFGLTSVALSALAAGACLLPRSSFDAAGVAALIREKRITALLGVPAMYAKLLEHASSHALRLRPNALRLAYTGGAPIDPGHRQRYEDLLGLTLCVGYGLTEAAPTVTRTLASQAAVDAGSGTPLPGIELSVRDPATRATLPSGAVGLLFMRGPNVMAGYFRDAAATAAAIDAEGWLDTGDLAKLDAHGRLFIAGRQKELIIRSGFNVYPMEVEQAICAHAGVETAAVLGHARGGNEEVVAFVTLHRGARVDLEALREHLKPRLAAYKMPSELRVRDSLPLLPSGKVDKPALRRELDAAG